VGKLMCALAVFSVGVFVPASIATAETQDKQYLATLSEHGIQGDAGVLIAAGRSTCEAMNNPSAFGQAQAFVGINAQLAGQGLNQPQMTQLMRDAISVYCPDKSF